MLAASFMTAEQVRAFVQPSPAARAVLPLAGACRLVPACLIRPGRSCRSSLRSRKSGATSAGTVMAVEVSPLTDVRYVKMLSELCCEAFYGVQGPWEKLNPIGQVQRGLVVQEIELDLKMRMDRYRRATSATGRSCGAILVAVDDGALAGFVDVSLTLYDVSSGNFFVSQGPGHSVPSDSHVRRPYIANLGEFRMFCRRWDHAAHVIFIFGSSPALHTTHARARAHTHIHTAASVGTAPKCTRWGARAIRPRVHSDLGV